MRLNYRPPERRIDMRLSPPRLYTADNYLGSKWHYDVYYVERMYLFRQDRLPRTDTWRPGLVILYSAPTKRGMRKHNYHVPRCELSIYDGRIATEVRRENHPSHRKRFDALLSNPAFLVACYAGIDAHLTEMAERHTPTPEWWRPPNN